MSYVCACQVGRETLLSHVVYYNDPQRYIELFQTFGYRITP